MSEQDLPPDVVALFDVTTRKNWKKDYGDQFKLIRRLLSEKKPDKKRILVEVSLLVMCGIKCFTLRDTDEILFYNTLKGVWEYGAENIIRQITHKVDDELTSHNINEVIDKVRRTTYGPRDLFVNNPHLALQNCVINLETLEIEPHKPEHYLTSKLEVEYDPDAIPHNIERFLSQILPFEDIPKVQEMIGYCLLPDYRFQKAFLCVGKGANGKSTLLNLIISFLDPENVSNVLMQDFDRKQFAASKLYGKMANIAADLPEKEMKQTGMFKMLTGGDRITAERKYKEPFEFVNKAKLIFSMNKPPAIYDDVDAIWRRLCLIHFPYQFVGKDADTNLLKTLTTPEELSGLLNASLMALFRLKERGCFEIDENIQNLRTEYLLASNPIQCFAEYVLEDDFDGRELKKDIDQAYIKYTKLVLRQVPKPIATLTKALPKLKEHVSLKHPRIDGKKNRCWYGVKIRDEFQWLLSGTGGTIGTSFPPMLVLKDKFSKYIGPNVVPAVPAVPVEKRVPKEQSKMDQIDKIIDALARNNEEELVNIKEIVNIGLTAGVKREFTVKYVDELTRRGLYFEPQQGVIRKVD